MCGCWSHHGKGAPCNCACHTRLQGRVVEPEFVVGQQVKDGDYDRLPVGAKAGTLEKTGEHEWRDLSGRPLFQEPHATRTLTHLPATEPEDKDDLYVEPEPLKRGDAVLVWARVVDAKPDSDGDLEVVLDRAPGGLVDDCEAYVRADAIVRPDAGQVPPWIKAVEEPTGLGAVVVVNTNGWKWVRSRPGYADPWQQVGGDGQRRWSDFPADVEVLSEGWTGGAS